MKKILYCASAASHIDNFHLPYIKRLHELGWEVHVCASGIPVSKLIDKSFDLPFVKRKISLCNLATVRKMRRIIDEERYDAVFTQASLAGLLGRMAAIAARCKPRIVHICHGYLFNDDGGLHSKIMLAPEKLLGRKTDRLLVMNDDDLKIAEKYKLCADIRFINGMGLNCAAFPAITAEKRRAIREGLGVSEGTTVFLSVGEFSDRKNQQLMIRAMKQLHNKKALLILVGNGERLNACRALAMETGIDGQIIFAYKSCSINDYLHIADVFVAASVYEGLPFCVMEALYCGLPVIASAVKGHTDLICDGNGYLFEQGNVTALCERMQAVMGERWEHVNRLEPKYCLNDVLDVNMREFGFTDNA